MVRLDCDVANVAVAICPCAQELRPQAKIQSEIRGGLPVILREDGRVVLPVGVVIDASASETELGRAADEISEVG